MVGAMCTYPADTHEIDSFKCRHPSVVCTVRLITGLAIRLLEEEMIVLTDRAERLVNR